VLALAAVGVAAIAGLALTLVSALVAQGRRRSLTLARWRGASMAQLLGAELVAGLALAVPAAALGWVLATLAVPARPSAGSLLAAAAVAGAVVLVLLVATALSILAARRGPERPDEAAPRIGPRRLVAEGLVVALAVAGAVLLRNRGLLAEGATGGAPGVDPLLAATPVLLGAAAGLVTVRVYPLPVRLLGRLAALRRDLVPLHALQRTARASSSSHAPLLVLLLAVAIGTFSSVMLVTIERGQSETAWREVGADFRVDRGPADRLPSGLDPMSVEGVEAVATAYDDDNARLVGRSFGGERILVRALDGDAYRELVAGTPADPRLPAALLSAASDDAGSEEAPLPAIVSSGFEGSDGEEVGIGDVFEISIVGNHLSVEAVARRGSFPGIDGESFVIVSYDWLRAAIPDHEFLPTVLFVRGDDAADAGLRSIVEEALPPAELVSRPGRYAELRESPLVRAVDTGFALALVATTAYTLLGVAAALALRAGARARDLARLSTLGLSRRQVTGLTLIEYGPPLVVALAAGTALGVAIAWLLTPGLRLDALLGATSSGALAIDPSVVAGVILLETAVAAAGMLAAAWAVRRLALARAVRGDDE
jgi:putative ABC transport system permease protein